MSEEEIFIDALEHFYKLKNNYDTKINKQKDKIIRNNKLSKVGKRKQFKKMIQNSKCIKCNQLGGTHFSSHNHILKANCGSSKKCKLNIELDRGKVSTYEEVSNSFESRRKRLYSKTSYDKIRFII